MSKEESEQWLREYIKKNDGPMRYELMIEGIIKAYETGFSFIDEKENYWISWDEDLIILGGADCHMDVNEEFWNHIQTVIGLTIPPSKRPEYFGCSC